MESMIGQGLVLTLLGMGVVFAFLVLLVVAMAGLAAFFTRFAHVFPDAVEPAAATEPDSNSTKTVAVIMAAIRAKQRR